MKHRVAGRRLDRTTEHRTAMFKNMVTSLLRHERIVTTTPKAKELRRIADRIITLGKRGTPHARRQAHRSVRDVEVLDKLFGPIAQRFQSRPGGYTRLVRVARRLGDAAEMALIELTELAPAEAPEKGKGEKAGKKAPEKKAEKKPEKKGAPKEKAAAEKKPEKKAGKKPK
ncbi:MAG TPA: 50S ribosomal protein L17 [Anaeromyxobacteraceae bacterium]|nr:50S ribosomal protein L17 [Anaeromyxobacteraceae bacterium]